MRYTTMSTLGPLFVLMSLGACMAGGSGLDGRGSQNNSNGAQDGATTSGSTSGGGTAGTVGSMQPVLSALVGGPGLDTNSLFPPPGMDCGTQLAPQGNVLSTPPTAFVNACAGCHGPTGAGHNQYPNIATARSFGSFSATVRGGLSGGAAIMPSFPTAWLNDNDLNRIYAYLTGSSIVESGACQSVAPMTAAQIADAYSRGLAAWRKPGAADPNGIFTGAACVNCHGPDGLELAYLGYADSDIMRRAAMHLGEADYAGIVDMVHALRTKYNIVPRDPKQVRPFQPGGQLLPGTTVVDRDAAFASELQQMGLTVLNGYVNSVADAARAEAEIAGINRHTLRIPIPFNHWTEDQFHNPQGYVPDCSADIDTCADHGTISDWIPSAPHMPTSLATAYTAMDAYLANPNDAGFKKMVGSLPNEDTMPGTYPTGEIRFLDGGKYPAIYLATHCMRLEVMGLPGCYDKGLTPYPYQDGMWGVGTLANLWGTGYEHYTACNSTWQSCDSAPANLPVWPQHLLADMTPGSLLSDHFQRLRHTWMAMWWTHFDPTLLVTGDPTAEQDEYFSRSFFWSNNNDWDNYGVPVHATYSVYNVYQILMHNVTLLNVDDVGSVFSCKKFPFMHPDLGAFPCTTVDMRSGYFPELTNFAEGKDFIHNTSKDQITYQPTDARRAAYQMLTGNMYRLFFWKLIGDLQQPNGNWMCRPDIEQLRITRAQTFLNQPEIVAANGTADTAMFNTLQTLMKASVTNCPAFVP